MIKISGITVLGNTSLQIQGQPVSRGYWFATLDGIAGSDIVRIATDAEGNVYASGGMPDSAAKTNGFLVKINPLGDLVYQTQIGETLSDDKLNCVCVDSQGYVYSAGSTTLVAPGVASDSDFLVVKRDPVGNLVWQKRYRKTTTSDQVRGIDVDDFGNIYIAGYGGTDGGVIKLDNNGNILWQKLIRVPDKTCSLLDVVVRNGYVYVCGSIVVTGSSTTDALFMKLNPADGSVIWQRRVVGSANENARGIEVTADGTVISVGSGDSKMQGFKFTDAGTNLWRRGLGPATTGGGDIAIDDNSSYFIGNRASGHIVLYKYGFDNTRIYKKDILINGGTGQAWGIATDNQGAMYIAGYINKGSNQPFIARLPTDGTLTGTYGTFTYQTGTADVVTPSGSLSTTTPTLSDFGSTVEDTTLTSTTSSFTVTKNPVS